MTLTISLRKNPPPEREVPAPPRLAGVDVARAVAVMGMVLVHTAPVSLIGERTYQLLSGRSAALFAVLAGVSLALLSGRGRPHEGARLTRDRWSIAARGLVLFALGLLLVQLGTSVMVILCTYGALFWIALPLLPWGWRQLGVAAVVAAVVGPGLSLLIRVLLAEQNEFGVTPRLDMLTSLDGGVTALRALLLDGAFPVLTWLPFLLAGMAVGRWLPGRERAWAWLTGLGATVALVGYGASHIALHPLGGRAALLGVFTDVPHDQAAEIVDFGLTQGGFGTFPTHPWQWILGSAPHSGTPFEIIGSTGIAMVVIGLSLLAARSVPRFVAPVATLGRFPLTVYVGHILALALLAWMGMVTGGWLWMVGFAVLPLVLANLWDHYLGRGPLERGLTWVGDRAGRLART